MAALKIVFAVVGLLGLSIVLAAWGAGLLNITPGSTLLAVEQYPYGELSITRTLSSESVVFSGTLTAVDVGLQAQTYAETSANLRLTATCAGSPIGQGDLTATGIPGPGGGKSYRLNVWTGGGKIIAGQTCSVNIQLLSTTPAGVSIFNDIVSLWGIKQTAEAPPGEGGDGTPPGPGATDSNQTDDGLLNPPPPPPPVNVRQMLLIAVAVLVVIVSAVFLVFVVMGD